ncbi:MAG: hypothetical protein AAGD32_00495 [Planctomycetota bacterium]
MQLWPHHEAALASIVPELDDKPDALCLILGGSLVRGWGTEASDIDGHLLITDDAFDRAIAADDLVYKPAKSHCDYPGGYFDLKLVSRRLLEEAAVNGSEPFRNSYVDARVHWSRLNEPIDDLLRAVATYPEDGHAEKLVTLACHLEGMKWYAGEARKRDDAYLMLWCAQRVVLFAGRLVLAHNRMLFPYHKWLMRMVDRAPDKPAGLRDKMDAAVGSPSVETIEPLCDLLLGWQLWGVPPTGWWNPWIRETEWAWRSGTPSVDER